MNRVTAAMVARGERRLGQRRSYVPADQRREIDRDVWLSGERAAVIVRLENELRALRIVVADQARLLEQAGEAR